MNFLGRNFPRGNIPGASFPRGKFLEPLYILSVTLYSYILCSSTSVSGIYTRSFYKGYWIEDDVSTVEFFSWSLVSRISIPFQVHFDKDS